MKENDVGQRYSESTYTLTNQENNKGIKSFRLLFDRYLLGNCHICCATHRIFRAFIVWSYNPCIRNCSGAFDVPVRSFTTL